MSSSKSKNSRDTNQEGDGNNNNDNSNNHIVDLQALRTISIDKNKMRRSFHSGVSSLRSVQSGPSLPEEDLSREISATSLLSGNIDLDLNFNESEETDNKEEEQDRDTQHKQSILSSSSSMSSSTTSFQQQQSQSQQPPSNQDFDLHLPDFEQLMNQYSQRPPKAPTSNAANNAPTTPAAKVTPVEPISNISIGTAPSVKSQYYHSTTSRMDSEGMSIGGESEYESLFSDESYLSISNEGYDKEFIEQQKQLQMNPSISSNQNNHNDSSIPPLPLANQPFDDEEGYQTPTSVPSSRRSYNPTSSPNTVGGTRSLSSAASNLLNSATTTHASHTLNNNGTTAAGYGQGVRKAPHASPMRQSTHRRLEQSIDFLNDDVKTMTYSRRIALFLSSRYKWYNPRLNKIYTSVHDKEDKQKNDKNQQEKKDQSNLNDVEDLTITSYHENVNSEPSIEVAWAYYEHMTLPRRLIKSESELDDTHRESLNTDKMTNSKRSLMDVIKSSFRLKNRKLSVAIPGESDYETKLYGPWSTPMSQMGDFGLGVGLYFGTLRAFTVLLFLAGIVNIPNLMFYGGEKYSNSQENVEWWLKGSAACNDHTWVPCWDCLEGESPFSAYEKSYRNYKVTNSNNQTMTFVMKNECDGAIFRVGMVNFGTVLLFIVGMIIMAGYLRKKQIQFDLDEQTPQDYSISIYNPPPDAYDPAEWKKYFKETFPDCAGMHVTSVTIAVDNDDLLDCLTQRRELIKKLKLALPDMENVEDVAALSTTAESVLKKSNCIQKLYINKLGVPAMYKKLVNLNETIKMYAKKEHKVTSVFVMFETEKAQRHVLEKLTVSKHSVKNNNIHALSDRKYLFRGERVLHVAEAEEPSTIRWKELNITKKDLFVKLLTTLVVFGFIVLVAYIVNWCNNINNDWAATAIALFNVVFPQIAKLIASVERHSREEHMQVWLYFKIAFFRWVNTALVIWMITPFTSTTLTSEGGVLLLVYKIFLAEIITTNVLKWLDPAENFKKHFIAPRASTQEDMNLYFRGSEVFLAERYTNLTKIVFLSVWYCSVYPLVLFMGAVALGVNYYFDRFAIMRTWRPQPKLGVSISHYTKYYVFPLTIIAMTFFANYMWAGFRFDRICDTMEQIEPEYVDSSWEIPIPKGTSPTVDIDMSFSLPKGTTYYEFCKRKYTDDQSRIVSTFSYLGFVNVAIVSTVFLVAVFLIVQSYFYTKYEPVGDDQEIPMRHVDSMTAYIPQVTSDSFAYPLIACNVDKIKGSELFEWEDPLRPYEYYDLTKDLKNILDDDELLHMDESKIFSKMVHWPYRSLSR